MRPGSATSVEFGVTVLMFASVVCLGKLASQLPLKNQLEENCPVQLVWACVDDVAASSAMVAVVVSKYARICSPPAKQHPYSPQVGMRLRHQEVEVKDFSIALCRFASKCGFYDSTREASSNGT